MPDPQNAVTKFSTNDALHTTVFFFFLSHHQLDLFAWSDSELTSVTMNPFKQHFVGLPGQWNSPQHGLYVNRVTEHFGFYDKM